MYYFSNNFQKPPSAGGPEVEQFDLIKLWFRYSHGRRSGGQRGRASLRIFIYGKDIL